MIALPNIALSARFGESAWFMGRVQSMAQRDLRPLLLHGQSDVIGATIRIEYVPTGNSATFMSDSRRRPFPKGMWR